MNGIEPLLPVFISTGIDLSVTGAPSDSSILTGSATEGLVGFSGVELSRLLPPGLQSELIDLPGAAGASTQPPVLIPRLVDKKYTNPHTATKKNIATAPHINIFFNFSNPSSPPFCLSIK
ncbi:MAG: hypothetical protein ORN26_00160 [Candidatus Pacebacteria bacterium]|nr:hypothetical protein [Candidatus Paceibacterota bacterium]